MAETALIVGEFYFAQQQMEVPRRSVRASVGGLGPLARQYGVDVGDDPDAAEAPPAPVSPPTARHPNNAASAPPYRRSRRCAAVRPKPVRLENHLDKRDPNISLERRARATAKSWSI
ncbi:MAG: hypothetical protein IPI57_18960 [Candidatus Competibacteraceae bacterium]|nr:hypothetical protein [Candidatus Competibacteraceae bacterium]